MAIVKKPKPAAAAKQTPAKANVNVGALIQKGGSTAGAGDKEEIQVQLRLSASLLRTIDDLVAAREVRTPRHTWLVEAVREKIKREQANV